MGSLEVEEQPIRRSLQDEGRTPPGVVGGNLEGGSSDGDDGIDGGRDSSMEGYGDGDGSGELGRGGGGRDDRY